MAPGPPAVTGLVVVDAQVGLLHGSAAVPSAPELLPRLAALLGAARAAGALVVHLQHDGEPGAVDAPGGPGWAIHPAVAPTAGEVVLHTSVDDGFDGTGLDDVLRTAGVERLAVAGLLSEMCVSATARSAMRRGLAVVLVTDGHATYDLDDIPHHVVARVAAHALGDEVTLAPAAEIAFAAPRRRRR